MCSVCCVCAVFFGMQCVCVCVCVCVATRDTDKARERENGGVSLATYCMLHEEINASLAAISA